MLLFSLFSSTRQPSYMEGLHLMFFRVLFHCILIVFTGGLWLLWLFVRFLLKNSR